MAGFTTPCDTAVAVCGMGLRLPGGLNTPSALYEFLLAGKDARGVPDTKRYGSNSITYSGNDGQNHTLPSEGYWLDWDEITGWDPSVFSSIGLVISQTEVEKMDPQQRILLRVVWEALESASETHWKTDKAKADRIGCFVGSFGDDWREMHGRDSLDPPKYRLTGYGDFSLSNRVSNCFGLGGPSVSVRAACASAGLALHLACQAIKAGECDAAIVAGSNIIFSPDFALFLAEQGVLSPEASCRTFDARASGYARAEAVNCLYIKRHSLAIEDSSPIRAIIRGSAVNANGRTAGMSTPSSEAQESLIRAAYHQAGIPEREIVQTAMVECHGTGTPVGDTMETCALANIFGQHGVFIGSVKPALGHSEASSTITSVMKAILSLENRTILPNIKFENPNVQIPFAAGKLTVPITPTPWPADRLHRIGVSSFGIGGTNVHIILDSASSVDNTEPFREMSQSKEGGIGRQERTKGKPVVLLLSAATEASLQRTVELHKNYCKAHPPRLERLAYTVNHRRIRLPHRYYCVFDENGKASSTKAKRPRGSHVSSRPGVFVPVAFIFSGPDEQWSRMGVELFKYDGNFLDDIKLMDDTLQRLPYAHRPTWSIRGELMKREQSRLGEPEIASIISTAIQIALTRLLGRHGVQPEIVTGYSSGEIAAAHAAGILSLRDAITLACYTNQSLPNKIGLVPDRNVGLDPKHLQVISEEYLSCFQRPKPAVELFSTSFNQPITGSINFGSNHRSQSKASAVEFRQAIKDILIKSPAAIHLGVGPDSLITGPLEQIYSEAGVRPSYISTMARGLPATTTFLSALGELYSHGVAIQMPRPHNYQKPLVDLDPYQWDMTKHYWPKSRVAHTWRFRDFPPHELIGTRSFDDGGTTATWRCQFSIDNVPWVKDHCVGSDVVFPAAAFIAMAGEVSFQLTGEKSYTVKELVLDKALVLVPGASIEIMTSTRLQCPNDSKSGWREVCFSSLYDGAWTTHCTGFVKPASTPVSHHGETMDLALSGGADRFVRQVDTASWYRAMARVGYSYGPAFRGVQDISANISSASVKCRILDRTSAATSPTASSSYALHPTTLDKMIQLLLIAKHRGQPRLLRQTYLPTYVGELTVGPTLMDKSTECFLDVYAVIMGTKGDGISRGSLVAKPVAATTGVSKTAKSGPVISINGLQFDPVDSVDANEKGQESYGAMQMTWKPDVDFIRESSLLCPRTDPENVRIQELLEALFHLCAIDVQDAAVMAPADRGHDPDLAHLTKLTSWLDSYLCGHEKQMESIREDRKSKKQRLLNALRDTPGSAAAELLSKCASNADRIFNGTVSPLDLFLEENALHRLYDWMNSLWSYDSFFELLSHKYGKHLRVLEVGAGTGGLTARVLAHLVPPGMDNDAELIGSYTFTDISAGFFPSAKERFQTIRGIEYRVLDITRDPLTQGFKAEYDLVIASNVLHATADLTQTLRHVKALLKPNGRLLLQELACEFKWINLIMGFLSGWWLGASDGRGEEPYIDRRAWDERLRLASFAPLETYVRDTERPHQINATMIAKPVFSESGLADVSRGNIALLHDGLDDTSLPLVERLEQRLIHMRFKPIRQQFRPGPGTAGNMQPLAAQNVISVLDLSEGGPFLANLTRDKLEGLLKLLKVLQMSDATLLWLTRACQIDAVDPNFAQILGFARSVRQETGLSFVTLELESLGSEAIDAACKVLDRSFSQSHTYHTGTKLDPDKEFAYASKTNSIVIPRCSWISVPEALAASRGLPTTTSKQAHLQISRPGQLDNLAWVQRCDTNFDDTDPGPGMVDVRVEAAGLNFKDVLMAMGTETTRADGGCLGCEAAGIVTAVGASVSKVRVGDRVMLFAPGTGCLATSARISQDLCAPIPDQLAFTQAAGMPCVYLTVIRALVDKANLGPGQTVLIHSAAGGVGIAAIQVARWLGAKIYATVGSEPKAQFLQKEFGIPQENIFHSRDDSFAHRIMAATGGRGVDVVLNSLSGQLLHASWQCVAPCGTFVELGKRDIVGRGKLAMEPLGENRAFVAVDMAHLATHNAPEICKLLHRVVDLYEHRATTPVKPLRIYPHHAVTEGFRSLYTGTNIGKIVIDISGDTGGQVSLASSPSVLTGASTPSPVFTSTDAYVLFGGPHGLSASLGRWMACHGARHFVFLSRSIGSPPRYKEDEELLRELRGMGCTVKATRCDVTDEAAVERSIASIAKTRRIAGVLHMAGLLLDTELEKLTVPKWRLVTDPKVAGTWNLHRALLLYAPDVDFFVLAGSMIGITGNSGQASYAASNAFLDSFVQYRRTRGLACSVLDIGVVEDVGILSRQPEILQGIKRTGVRTLNEQTFLDGMQLAMTRSKPTRVAAPAGTRNSETNESISSAVFRFTCGAQVSLGFSSTLPLDDPSNSVLWKRDARMALYNHIGDLGNDQNSNYQCFSKSSSSALTDFISRASRQPAELDSPACFEFLAVQIFRRVQSFLMRDDEAESNGDGSLPNSSLASLGMDSLMTIEIRNWWRLTFGTSVSLLQLTSAPNFEQLGKLAARQMSARFVASVA